MNNKYYYEYEWDSKYCYPKSYVLKNKLNIKVRVFYKFELRKIIRAVDFIRYLWYTVNINHDRSSLWGRFHYRKKKEH